MRTPAFTLNIASGHALSKGMTDASARRSPNRLSDEKSPYLLQHQYNPVDWYPWGEEAFARARAENKPLLISIGYSACHWCHVMEHESFSDEAIANVINATVIPVKVDREERPDVDAIYMNACTAMTGQGGWPLNAFVTPDLKPFFVGTYFPPTDNYGRPGFVTVLERIREAWVTDGAGLVQQAEALHQQLENFSRTAEPQSLSSGLLEDVINDCSSNYDLRNGGFGSAPKFPPDTRLALLLAAFHATGSQAALKMVTGTLDAMAYGGMYDQIAGGFARYSVDAKWLIPHFEKMLYNQALLVPVYADAWLVTRKPLYEQIARETCDWVLRDLTAEDGAFQCAYDADSEGEEGRFYVWTPQQVREVLPDGDDADLFCDYYGITPRGNFEHGTSNPHVGQLPDLFVSAHGMPLEAWETRLQPMKEKMREARNQRVWPGLDDKCLTGWNGLMISALCKMAQAFEDGRYSIAAGRAANTLLQHQWREGILYRVLKNGESRVRGTLEDYAFFTDGLIDLYETDFDGRWLQMARDIGQRMVELFDDSTSGGFFYTDGTDASLISRTKDNHDGALPAAASIAIRALLRLGHYFRDETFTAAARQALAADGRRANSHPTAYASLLLASLYSQPDLPEITLTGPSEASIKELVRSVRQVYLPARIVAANLSEMNGEDASGNNASLPPLALEKAPGETARAYLCRNFTCLPPVSSATELAEKLTQAPPL